MNTAICYYYNGQLIPNSIAETTINKESSIIGMSQGYIRAFNVIERKLGIEHVRIFRTPYKADSFKHVIRTPQWEPYFLSIEAQVNTKGLTDIFIVECVKDKFVSDDKLIIDEYRDEYSPGFLILPGEYEDLESFINFHRSFGWKADEVIDTIKRFLTFNCPSGWEMAHHYEKLRRLAALNLELLGLESLPELTTDKFINAA